MNERLNHHPGETIKPIETPELNRPKSHNETVHHKSHSKEELSKISKEAELNAISGSDISVEDNDSRPSNSVSIKSFQSIKASSYNKTLASTRKHLSASDRKLSKFIHKPTVENISDTMASTVARPKSLFSAGLITFIGSLVILMMARKYGFTYNHTLFIVLFAVGYTFGLGFELIIYLFRRNK